MFWPLNILHHTESGQGLVDCSLLLKYIYTIHLELS